MNNQPNPKTFEERIERLQSIINIIEKGNIPLEESVALYKEGMELNKLCRNQLEKARHEISIYSEKGEELFDPDCTGEEV